jgi:hypothetical protein
VVTMIGLQEGVSVADLGRRQGYLTVTDSEAGIEALWHLLIEHGEGYLRAAAATIGADPALRRLRPWVGHGTLHLLHPRDRIGSVRYGLAFYRTAGAAYRLDVYGDESMGPAEPLESAVARAAAAAADRFAW